MPLATILRRATLAATLLLGLAAPAAALEHTRFEPLWIDPAFAPGEPPAVPYDVPALLNLPPGWMLGDAAAVIIADPPPAQPWPDRLTAALLAAGAAVLELDVFAARGLAPDSDGNPALATRDLLADAFGTLLALRREAGAGVVVLLGTGIGGEAALLAGEEAVAARHVGPAGPRFAAVAGLGPGRPGFAAGVVPPAREAWGQRAPLLCALLARAVAHAALPLTGDATAPWSEAMLDEECRAALLPSAAHLAGVPR
jgi:hypothetical protein